MKNFWVNFKLALLAILMFAVQIFFPEKYNSNLIGLALFIIYTVIIYTYFNGFDGEFGDGSKKAKKKLFKFIRNLFFVLIIPSLILLDFFINEGKTINFYLDLILCTGSSVPVSSGCYEQDSQMLWGR